MRRFIHLILLAGLCLYACEEIPYEQNLPEEPLDEPVTTSFDLFYFKGVYNGDTLLYENTYRVAMDTFWVDEGVLPVAIEVEGHASCRRPPRLNTWPAYAKLGTECVVQDMELTEMFGMYAIGIKYHLGFFLDCSQYSTLEAFHNSLDTGSYAYARLDHGRMDDGSMIPSENDAGKFFIFVRKTVLDPSSPIGVSGLNYTSLWGEQGSDSCYIRVAEILKLPPYREYIRFSSSFAVKIQFACNLYTEAGEYHGRITDGEFVTLLVRPFHIILELDGLLPEDWRNNCDSIAPEWFRRNFIEGTI